MSYTYMSSLKEGVGRSRNLLNARARSSFFSVGLAKPLLGSVRLVGRHRASRTDPKHVKIIHLTCEAGFVSAYTEAYTCRSALADGVERQVRCVTVFACFTYLLT